MGIPTRLSATPSAEKVEALADVGSRLAVLIPFCDTAGSAGAIGVRDCKILQAEGDVEGVLVGGGGGVDDGDDVGAGGLCGVEC